MKFFNLDLHISVIKDLTNIIKTLYGDEVTVTNWSISGHNWVFKQNTAQVDIINNTTWESIDEQLINDFNAKYDLSEYDGFIVTHSTVFAMIFEKYNKPIICVNSCRYDMPFCWRRCEKLSWLNEGLQRMHSRGQLIVVSNNLADQEYLRRGTNIISKHIPSLCDYTNATYNPTNNCFVIYGESKLFENLEGTRPRPSSGYTWNELYSYKGIIHNPYEISTMSIAEQITAGVPLFFPTKRFYKECIQNNSMKLTSNYGSNIQFSVDEWLDRGDFYTNYNYVYYYDSIEDLQYKINTFNDSYKEERQKWLQERKALILSEWNAIFLNTFKYIHITPNINTLDIIQSDKLWNYFKLNSYVNYLKTDALFEQIIWRDNQHYNFNKKKILITTHSDRGIDENTYNMHINKCDAWYTNNIQTNKPDLRGIPLGITNLEPNSYLHSVYSDLDQIMQARQHSFNKKYLCYMNFNTGTFHERKRIWDNFCGKEWIKTEQHVSSTESRCQFLNTMAHSKFAICPRGNGVDTHRLWESLYVGTIPIVIQDICHRDWQDLPILFINDWNEVTQDFLEKKWDEITSKKWNLDKLKMGYWINCIKEEIRKTQQIILPKDCYYLPIDFTVDPRKIIPLLDSLDSGKKLYIIYRGAPNRKYLAYFEEYFPEILDINDCDISEEFNTVHFK